MNTVNPRSEAEGSSTSDQGTVRPPFITPSAPVQRTSLGLRGGKRGGGTRKGKRGKKRRRTFIPLTSTVSLQ